MLTFEPREGHRPGNQQRLINDNSICLVCDGEYATVFDDLCEECFKGTEIIEF